MADGGQAALSEGFCPEHLTPLTAGNEHGMPGYCRDCDAWWQLSEDGHQGGTRRASSRWARLFVVECP